jgi:hypothetical protein
LELKNISIVENLDGEAGVISGRGEALCIVVEFDYKSRCEGHVNIVVKHWLEPSDTVDNMRIVL